MKVLKLLNKRLSGPEKVGTQMEVLLQRRQDTYCFGDEHSRRKPFGTYAPEFLVREHH